MARTRRTLAVAVALVTGTVGTTMAGVAGLAATGGAAQAADDTPGYSLHHLTVQTMTGPEGDVPCAVDADLYLPDGASRRHKVPAILTTNGFGGAKDDDQETSIGRGFVEHGYAVLAYTGLGFPDSGCKITLDDPAYDGKAGKQMVDVLAGTRSYTEGGVTKRLRVVAQESQGDPRVGMIGGSYGGQIQYAVAEQDPRVDALIPIITWNDLSYSLAPNNVDLARGVTSRTPGVGKREWIGLFFGEGIADGVAGAGVDPTRVFPPCPNFSDEACQAAARLETLGYPDAATLALARHASVESYVKRVKAATLLVQGQRDSLFNLQEAVATFRSLRAQGTPTRMIWQSWGHSYGTPAPGELDFTSLRSSYLGRRFLDWMNHYVRGRSSAPVGPRFSYFEDWVKYDTSAARAGTAIAKAYGTARHFSNQPTATLYLSGTKSLAVRRSRVVAGTSSYANAPGAPTSYSETSGLEGNQVNNPTFDGPGTFASYTSRPLAHATAIVGSPQLNVHLTAPVAAAGQDTDPAAKLVLFAKLYDVAPDGTKTLQHRLVSPVRVGDVDRTVSIQLPAVVQRLRAGHRIQVVLAASDAAYAGNDTVQPVSVRTSPLAPGTLRLPLTRTLCVR